MRERERESEREREREQERERLKIYDLKKNLVGGKRRVFW